MRRKGRKILFGTHQFQPRNTITSCTTQSVRDYRFRAGTRFNHEIFAPKLLRPICNNHTSSYLQNPSGTVSKQSPFLIVGLIGPHTISVLGATFWLAAPRSSHSSFA